MSDIPVGLNDSLLKPDSTDESKLSGTGFGKSLTQDAKKQKQKSQSTILNNLMHHCCLLFSEIQSFSSHVLSTKLVEAVLDSSPKNIEKFKKTIQINHLWDRTKVGNICGEE